MAANKKPQAKTEPGVKIATKTGNKTGTKDKSSTNLISTKKNIKTDIPLLNTPGDINAHDFDVTAQQTDADQVDLTDPNFNYGRVSANKLKADTLANRFMTAADYTLLDPADVQNEFGDINRNEFRKNAKVSSDLALDSIDTELQGLLNYAPTAANLQRQQVALDNTTNQSERLRMLESADPNIRADLESQRGRANAYAEGRVPDSILDRQLELGIQSSAADRAATGGFGAGSSAAVKAGQLMSAESRIGLSQYGDQLLSSNVGQRTSTLLAPQQLATGGSQINVMPTVSAGQTAAAIAGDLNSGNITSKDALSAGINQQQFKSGLEQEANTTNVNLAASRDLNQANLNLQADTTSEANRLHAEETNISNDINTQKASKEINSAERRFNAELNTNTKIANADRAFNADNSNAGRALEVTTSNRAVKLEVEKTNKTMVFQDQQRKKAEAFSSRQAAAANAGANARAAMSASSNAAAIAAQQDAMDKDRAFQLQQQQMAMEIYKQNRGDAQNSSTWAGVGTIITKAPDIIKGVGSIADWGSNLFKGDPITDLFTL